MRNSKKVVSNNLVSKNSQYVIERYTHIKQGDNWESIPSNMMTKDVPITLAGLSP